MKSIVQCVLSVGFAALVTSAAVAQSSVLTQDYDMARTGANLGEAILTPSNVSSATFGKLFSYPVDEEVHAQPLYVPNLVIAGGTHNVVFIATMGNSVFAFDADNAATSNTPLWSVNLGTPVPSSRWKFSSGNGDAHNGIYSTPVIDPVSNTIYVVTHLWSTSTQSVTLQLHALDVTTGNETSGSPQQISAPGFDPNVNEQRAGLLLLNGYIYVAMGSHSDIRSNVANSLKSEPYVGLVIAYSAQPLAYVASFKIGGQGASIWQGGRGLASDGTYIYAMTANAFTVGKPDYSESFVQLSPATLAVAGYFQDPDAACLNTLDLDLASSGPQVIPGAGTNLLIGGGKEAKVYELVLGQTLQTQTPQYFWATTSHPTLPAEGGTCSDSRPGGHGYLHGSDTAFWNNPGGASYYYAFGNYDQLMSWQVSGNTFTPTSADTAPSHGHNTLAVSANAGANGILWTVAPQMTGPAMVSAYNAVPSGGQLPLLWNSAQVPKRDALGLVGRYSVPTVANGKVYVGSGSNQVAVYGLLPATPSVAVTPTSATVKFINFNTNSQVIVVMALGGFTGKVNMSLTGLPSGVTYSFSAPHPTLSATHPMAGTTLSISPAGAVLPLNDNYTVIVQATTTTGVSSYAPIRIVLRTANYTSATNAGCNTSKQMSANLAWSFTGSGVPSIWIQDPTSPMFPGRLWVSPVPAKGSQQTGYWINNHQSYFYWLIDQSAGIPANFDNALTYTDLGTLYSCP